MKIAVVGSGSRVWQLLRTGFVDFNVIEIKGRSLEHLSEPINVDVVMYLVNSPVDKISSHIQLTIKHFSPKKFIMLSSMVVELPAMFDFYQYVKAKKTVEYELLRLSKYFTETSFLNIRCAPIVENFSNEDCGYPIYLPVNNLIEELKGTFKNDFSYEAVNMYEVSNKFSQNIVFDFFSRFHVVKLFRPLDIVFRLLGSKSYGYTYHLAAKIKNDE